MGAILPYRELVITSADISSYPTGWGVCTTGTKWVDDRDAAKHPTKFSSSKNYWVLVNKLMAEKPYLEWLNRRSHAEHRGPPHISSLLPQMGCYSTRSQAYAMHTGGPEERALEKLTHLREKKPNNDPKDSERQKNI